MKNLLLITVLLLTNVFFAQSSKEVSETEEYYLYHENGNIKLKAYKDKNTKDGEIVLNGEFTVYYEDGTIMKKGNSVNSKMDGVIYSYYESGKLQKIDNYKNGKPHGESKGYYEKGNLKYITHYKDNLHHGTEKSYYSNGNLQSEGNYIDGEPDGLWQYYYEEGGIKEEIKFKNGEKVLTEEQKKARSSLFWLTDGEGASYLKEDIEKKRHYYYGGDEYELKMGGYRIKFTDNHFILEHYENKYELNNDFIEVKVGETVSKSYFPLSCISNFSNFTKSSVSFKEGTWISYIIIYFKEDCVYHEATKKYNKVLKIPFKKMEISDAQFNLYKKHLENVMIAGGAKL